MPTFSLAGFSIFAAETHIFVRGQSKDGKLTCRLYNFKHLVTCLKVQALKEFILFAYYKNEKFKKLSKEKQTKQGVKGIFEKLLP